MGNWWQDEEPYPGPKVAPSTSFSTWKETLHNLALGVNYTFVGKGSFQGSMHEFSEKMGDIGILVNVPSPKIPTTREQLLERKKNLTHGPYVGGYDRRGRKY